MVDKSLRSFEIRTVPMPSGDKYVEVRFYSTRRRGRARLGRRFTNPGLASLRRLSSIVAGAHFEAGDVTVFFSYVGGVSTEFSFPGALS